MKKTEPTEGPSASALIDTKIATLADWRGETYKDKVKLTFMKGASLADPAQLFNASLDGNARRAIDIHAGEMVDAGAFKALIHAAIALNTTSAKTKAKRTT